MVVNGKACVLPYAHATLKMFFSKAFSSKDLLHENLKLAFLPVNYTPG